MINKNKIIKISIISLFILSFSNNVFAIEKNNEVVNESNLSESLNKKLYDAIENNNLLLVKELISKGVKVNQNRTIFEKFEELADSNYNINEYKEITPLMLASKKGNIEIVKFLLSNGADINSKINSGNNKGFTPLIYSLMNDQKEISKLLINNGANINDTIIVNDNIFSTLMLSSVNGEKEISELLIKNGVKYDLLILAKIGDLKRSIELIEKKVDIDVKDYYGRTPLILSLSHYGNTELAKLFVNNGANVNAKENDGNTPLIWALRYRDKEICELLINKGADINNKDEKGKTALIYALEHNYFEIVQILKKAGAK